VVLVIFCLAYWHGYLEDHFSMVLFLMNECLFIKSVIFQQITQLRTFYRNFHFLRQFHRNKHLKHTATFWKSSREIRNFRPQLSQKRPAKSWGDCIVKWWAHVMSSGN